MELTARCPVCKKKVDAEQTACPHCASRLTKARFTPVKLLFFGALAILVAVIISVIAVPVACIGIVIAVFSREKLHVMKFESGDGPDEPEGRTVEITTTD